VGPAPLMLDLELTPTRALTGASDPRDELRLLFCGVVVRRVNVDAGAVIPVNPHDLPAVSEPRVERTAQQIELARVVVRAEGLAPDVEGRHGVGVAVPIPDRKVAATRERVVAGRRPRLSGRWGVDPHRLASGRELRRAAGELAMVTEVRV